MQVQSHCSKLWTRLSSFHDDSFLSAGATEMSLESGQRLLAITLVLSAFQSSNSISAAGSWSSAQKTSNRSLLSLQRFQPGELTWCFDTTSWRSMSCIFMISVSPWNLTFPFWHILFITPDLFDVKWVKKEKFNFKVMLKSWKYKSHVFRRNRSFYRHEPSHVIVIAHGPGVDILHILDNRETEYINVQCPHVNPSMIRMSHVHQCMIRNSHGNYVVFTLLDIVKRSNCFLYKVVREIFTSLIYFNWSW